MEARRMTVRIVAEDVGLTMGTALEILTSKLKLKSVCTKWVPRLIKPEEKRIRVQICRDRTSRYSEKRDGFLNRIVTNAKHCLTLVLLNPDIPCLCKQCRSRSVGF